MLDIAANGAEMLYRLNDFFRNRPVLQSGKHAWVDCGNTAWP